MHKKKKKKINLWEPIDQIMENLPINIRKNVPNALTGIRVISSIGIVGTLATVGLFNPLLIGTWTALTAVTDLLDGKIARRYNCESKLGSALDAIADKVLNWGVGIALIIMGVVPAWSLFIGVRDLSVMVQNAEFKLEDGKNKRKNKPKSESKFKEMVKDYKEGEILPPTILGKAKMWGQSSAVVSGLLFSATPLSILTPILFGTTIAISAADLVLNTKVIADKKKSFAINQKETSITSTITNECSEEKTQQKTKQEKKNYPKVIEEYVDKLANDQQEDNTKAMTKK